MKRYTNSKEHKEWRKVVLERDNNTCQVCELSRKGLNAHHILPKSLKKWRTELDNGITLCTSCHKMHTFSAHVNPIWFTKWMINNKWELHRIASDRLRELDEDT